MTSYNVYIPGDIIPTAETKIKLADKILVSPLSEFFERTNERKKMFDLN